MPRVPGTVEKVGSLSERAAMGNRSRRLSLDGNAWDDFSHDQARSRAYRWGEDGLAGISDDPRRALLRPGALERADP